MDCIFVIMRILSDFVIMRFYWYEKGECNWNRVWLTFEYHAVCIRLHCSAYSDTLSLLTLEFHALMLLTSLLPNSQGSHNTHVTKQTICLGYFLIALHICIFVRHSADNANFTTDKHVAGSFHVSFYTICVMSLVYGMLGYCCMHWRSPIVVTSPFGNLPLSTVGIRCQMFSFFFFSAQNPLRCT